MAWGINTSPMTLQMFTSAIAAYVKSLFSVEEQKTMQVLVYMDDFAIFTQSYSVCERALKLLYKTLDDFGLLVSVKKSHTTP